MESHDAFKKREQALEHGYFAAQDAALLKRLRADSLLGDIAAALKEKLQVDDMELLQEIRDLGITEETGAALLLAPLVQVAWTDGSVSAAEREAVLLLAVWRGAEPESPAYEQLVAWLDERPADRLFEIALRTIDAGLSVLPPAERAEREQRVAASCKHVALASGGITGLFGLGGTISDREQEVLDAIAERLHSRGKPGS